MILGNFQTGKEIAAKNVRNYYRQHLGLLNDNNEKLVVLSMLDLYNSYIKNTWTKDIVAGVFYAGIEAALMQSRKPNPGVS